ncbi:hypothetical protein HN51_048151 [Arachis hypogaea]
MDGENIEDANVEDKTNVIPDLGFQAYANHLSGFAWNPVTRKFEAKEKVWQDFIKELFGADRATGKGDATSRERIQEIDRDHIDLNDSFENIEFSDIDVNMGHDTPIFSANLDSPSAPHSQPNQLSGTSTSRGIKRLAIMQQSRPRLYSESDVWDMLTELGLIGSARMQCYQFLCENEQKKRQIFGIPPEMRLDALFHFVTAAGVRLGDIPNEGSYARGDERRRSLRRDESRKAEFQAQRIADDKAPGAENCRRQSSRPKELRTVEVHARLIADGKALA